MNFLESVHDGMSRRQFPAHSFYPPGPPPGLPHVLMPPAVCPPQDPRDNILQMHGRKYLSIYLSVCLSHLF